MRVLIVIDGMNVGGAETMIMNINRVRDSSQIEFDFFLTQNENYFEREIISNKQFIYKSRPKSKHLIKYWCDLKRVIKNNNYKIVHIHASKGTAIFPVIIAKLSGVKNIIVHSHNSKGGNPFIQKVQAFLINLMVKDKLACTQLAGFWMFGKKSKFEVIDNPIDVRKFKFDPNIRLKYREMLNINQNNTVYIHVGRFSKQKNHSQLIKIYNYIASKQPNSTLLLIGSGELYEEIKRQVLDFNLVDKVKFLGIREDISNLMSASDFFLLPSLYEGFPLTIVEAQANGLKCIVSNTVTTMIKETDLISFSDVNNLSDWFKNTLNVSQDEDRCKYNEIIIRKYDANIIYNNLMKIYRGAANDNT